MDKSEYIVAPSSKKTINRLREEMGVINQDARNTPLQRENLKGTLLKDVQEMERRAKLEGLDRQIGVIHNFFVDNRKGKTVSSEQFKAIYKIAAADVANYIAAQGLLSIRRQGEITVAFFNYVTDKIAYELAEGTIKDEGLRQTLQERANVLIARIDIVDKQIKAKESQKKDEELLYNKLLNEPIPNELLKTVATSSPEVSKNPRSFGPTTLSTALKRIKGKSN